MKKIVIFTLLCTASTHYIQTQNQFVDLCTKIFSDLSKNTDFLYDYFSDHALETVTKPTKKQLYDDCALFLETVRSTYKWPDTEVIESEFFKKIAIPSALVAGGGVTIIFASLLMRTREDSFKKVLKPIAILGGLGMITAAGIHVIANGIKADRLLRFIS